MSTNRSGLAWVCLSTIGWHTIGNLHTLTSWPNKAFYKTGGDLIHSDPNVPPTLGQIQTLFQKHFSGHPSISPLRGFKVDFSGNSDFHKVYFSVKCNCGTAALISVEVSTSKSRNEVSAAVPSLVSEVESKATQFNSMTCQMHQQMRLGNAGK